MERYYFHVKDDASFEDEEGTVFPDMISARNAAVDMLAELLRFPGEQFWAQGSISVTVTDVSGLVLWVIDAQGRQAPASSRAKS